MKWSRGFIRLWLIGAALWYAAIAIYVGPEMQLCLSYKLKFASCYAINGPPVIALVLPVLLLASGFVTRWIILGFR